MNIMVAIVFGGMPISGGARSKIYAAVVGGFSYIILNNILDLLIDSTSGYGITQIVSAVFLHCTFHKLFLPFLLLKFYF